MKLLATVGLALVPLLMTGCTATSARAPAPAPTVTVTVTEKSATPTLRAGDAAPWDLHAVCAAESAISTLEQWRLHRRTAGRLDAGQADAVTQSMAVQYLEMREFDGAPAAKEDVDALAQASGTLDDPTIDLTSAAVRTARTGLHRTCAQNGLTIGVYAQGG